jgi:hypothetical protein
VPSFIITWTNSANTPVVIMVKVTTSGMTLLAFVAGAQAMAIPKPGTTAGDMDKEPTPTPSAASHTMTAAERSTVTLGPYENRPSPTGPPETTVFVAMDKAGNFMTMPSNQWLTKFGSALPEQMDLLMKLQAKKKESESVQRRETMQSNGAAMSNEGRGDIEPREPAGSLVEKRMISKPQEEEDAKKNKNTIGKIAKILSKNQTLADKVMVLAEKPKRSLFDYAEDKVRWIEEPPPFIASIFLEEEERKKEVDFCF